MFSIGCCGSFPSVMISYHMYFNDLVNQLSYLWLTKKKKSYLCKVYLDLEILEF